MTFAAKLRSLRLAAGLTQAELAERAGLHRSHVLKLEAGTVQPSLAKAAALAKALGKRLRVWE